jgi:cytoskeleton protein RodZ
LTVTFCEGYISITTLSTTQTGGDAKQMSLSLGEKLRQAREARGISISEVAEQTRISPLYLKSIENDDYKPLPGGIFNKGFVRSYARYIGFDEDEALADYSELVSANAAAEPEQTMHHSEVWTDNGSNRSIVPTAIFALVILVLLGGGIVLLVRYLSGPKEPAIPIAANSNSASQTGSEADNAVTPAASTPQPGGFYVGLKANDQDVWIGYTKDGTNSVMTLHAGDSTRLDVNNDVKISYAKVKVPNLELSINGKKITVKDGGSKGNLDIDINKSNVGQIFQSGEYESALTRQPVPRPTTRPAASPSPKGPPLTANGNTARRQQ